MMTNGSGWQPGWLKTGALLLGLAGLSLTAGQSVAAGKFTCQIGDPGTINAGSPTTFTASLSGGKPPYTISWAATPKVGWNPATSTGVMPGGTTSETTFPTDQ